MGNCVTPKSYETKKNKKAYKLSKSNQIGLDNLGNSCYINSVIHSLQGIPKVYYLLEDLKTNDDALISHCVGRILKILHENRETKYYKYIRRIKKVGRLRE
jgi:uncharacterized UBP type Zn finger protein